VNAMCALKFDWSVLDKNDICSQIKFKINTALSQTTSQNRTAFWLWGRKPLPTETQLVKLDLGSHEPEVIVTGIEELREDQVQISFEFSYQGNASMKVRFPAQINPNFSEKRVSARGRSHIGILSAMDPVVVPIHLALSQFRLEGQCTLSGTREEASIEFDGDFLHSYKISTSFDGCPAGPQVTSLIRDKLRAATRNLVEKPTKISFKKDKDKAKDESKSKSKQKELDSEIESEEESVSASSPSSSALTPKKPQKHVPMIFASSSPRS